MLKLLAAICLVCGSWTALAVETNAVPETASGDAGSSAAHDLAAVMARLETRMKDIRSVQADFTQEKKLAVLDSVVIIKGRMALEGDRFAWHVDEPVKYSMSVSGGIVRQWDEDTDKVRRDSMAGNPVFQSVADQLNHWFSGRYRELLKEYKAAVLAPEPNLVLRFEPVAGSAPARAVQAVTVAFQNRTGYIERLEILDLSGDRTAIVFENTRLNEPVPPESWQVERR